jgi:hypothetical protein
LETLEAGGAADEPGVGFCAHAPVIKNMEIEIPIDRIKPNGQEAAERMVIPP